MRTDRLTPEDKEYIMQDWYNIYLPEAKRRMENGEPIELVIDEALQKGDESIYSRLFSLVCLNNSGDMLPDGAFLDDLFIVGRV